MVDVIPPVFEWDHDPFPHLVIDNFFDEETATLLSAEFPAYESDAWNGNYRNPLEIKKTCNVWDRFPALTYSVIHRLNSLNVMEAKGDPGLHGGGWHIHKRGGRLNPHIDYSIHPKLGLQRKYNLLVYLTEGWEESWGGHFGLWNKVPGNPVKTVVPLFNRAVIFDTTLNYHGLATEVKCPPGICRKSIAMYYLIEKEEHARTHQRALFTATMEQLEKEDQSLGDSFLKELIKRRSEIKNTDLEEWDRK